MTENETVTVLSRTLCVVTPIPSEDRRQAHSTDMSDFTPTHIHAELVIDGRGPRISTVYAFSKAKGYVERTDDARLYTRDRDAREEYSDALPEYLMAHTKALLERDWSNI